MRLATAAGLALFAAGAAVAAPSPRPALLADLPDDVLAAARRAATEGASSAAVLDAVFAAARPYGFTTPGLRVLTDRRWFEVASVEGPGAPVLEVRRWPGDTVVAFYRLAGEGTGAAAPLPGLRPMGRPAEVGDWGCRDADLETAGGEHAVVWCEHRSERGRLGALGVPGDAGFGPSALPDLRDAVLAVVRRASVGELPAAELAPPILPDLYAPPRAADERRDSWESFQGAEFTLGLPPGLRAIRLDAGIDPPRPVPSATAWIRGRFVDRDGASVAVGDGTRAGYVALLGTPDEAWRAGVGPPLGAPRAERLDEARLDDLVTEWTGASRATVSHWKEDGFPGDWLVFRLATKGRGVEIGLPVVAGWRSLALFWIPVTWREAGLAPAPPPIDLAASLGIKFDRLGPSEQKRLGLVEGYLTVGGLRLDVPRGFWPVANLGATDGLPVTFVDAAGKLLGRLERRPAGAPELTPDASQGWTALPRPSAQRASAVWVRDDGAAVLVAKDGSGFVLLPEGDAPDRREAWRRMRESAAFVRAARRESAPGRS
ncbi:MAG TPA: hypothetical protein VFB67_03425 [Candidatus Polarisedimenticolaceae bacterium]|nr:hypothetical protein [Candidatus Polarisedimenticolaceae bacterium]